MDCYFYQKIEACKNKKACTKYNVKKTHVMHIKKLNQILEDRLKTKKIHAIIRLEQNYFRPQRRIRGATKNEVEKGIFQVHEHMEDIRNNKDMKRVKSQEKYDGRKL